MFGPEKSPSFLAIVLILSLTEYFVRRRSGASYEGLAVFSTIAIAVGQILSRIPTAALITLTLTAAYDLATFKLDADDWWAWGLGFLGVEFVYYWQHRFFHTVRWFWATHSVHHSPNEFTLPAAFRLGWTGSISGAWLFLVPLGSIGLPPLMIATLYMLNLQFQFFLHTELVGKLGPVEWIFNTPSHHRVHHGSNEEYLDRNYGGVLIIFDRMFGTFTEEDAGQPIRYGLTNPIETRNPLAIAFHEWGRIFKDVRSASSVVGVVHALFGRPGTFRPGIEKGPRQRAEGVKA